MHPESNPIFLSNNHDNNDDDDYHNDSKGGINYSIVLEHFKYSKALHLTKLMLWIVVKF